MKKLILKIGLYIGTAVAMLNITTPTTPTTPITPTQSVTQITESSPLYLDHAPTQATKGNMVVSWHYSHDSHTSHTSHTSHYSHYSG